MTITFKTADNFTAFLNMAEAMWANYRDDNQEPDFSLVERLMEELNASEASLGLPYPLTLPLSLSTVEMAQSVLANALEYTRDGYEPQDEPVIKEGEVTIQ